MTKAMIKTLPVGADFVAAFTTLKAVLAAHATRLSVKADNRVEYTLVTNSPSPFPQHKGRPMYFGSVRRGKSYVSFHLMPLYMNATLTATISPNLRKRMQGKTCFNFKNQPDAHIVAELEKLTVAGVKQWSGQNWL
jgi:hypothetical protein